MQRSWVVCCSTGSDRVCRVILLVIEVAADLQQGNIILKAIRLVAYGRDTSLLFLCKNWQCSATDRVIKIAKE